MTTIKITDICITEYQSSVIHGIDFDGVEGYRDSEEVQERTHEHFAEQWCDHLEAELQGLYPGVDVSVDLRTDGIHTDGVRVWSGDERVERCTADAEPKQTVEDAICAEVQAAWDTFSYDEDKE